MIEIIETLKMNQNAMRYTWWRPVLNLTSNMK